jgi:hypothetical protein
MFDTRMIAILTPQGRITNRLEEVTGLKGVGINRGRSYLMRELDLGVYWERLAESSDVLIVIKGKEYTLHCNANGDDFWLEQEKGKFAV